MPQPIASGTDLRDLGAVTRLGCTLVYCLATSSLAHADELPKPPTEADRLFEEGRAFAKEGKIAEACARFTKSFEIDHALGTELNLADCEEKLGHLRLAWRLFLAAADESQRSDDTKRTEFARARAEALAARLTEVVVNVAQPTAPGLAITIAGHPMEPAPVIRDRTEPGEIEIVATLPERPTFKTSVSGAAGASVSVDVPAFGARVIRVIPTHRRKSRVYLAWGVGAAGALSAIAGTIFALEGRSEYNTTVDGPHCGRVTGGVVCDDVGDVKLAEAQERADVGTVFAIGSGALLIGAAVLYLTAPRDRVTLVPSATTDHVGLAVRTAF